MLIVRFNDYVICILIIMLYSSKSLGIEQTEVVINDIVKRK